MDEDKLLELLLAKLRIETEDHGRHTSDPYVEIKLIYDDYVISTDHVNLR